MDINKASKVKLNRKGKDFFILVDPDKALAFKQGKLKDIRDVLAADFIFKNVAKSEKAAEHDMKKIFKTDDIYEVAGIILKEGNFELTTHQKSEGREEIKKRVTAIIARNAIDPRTGLPHPLQRIQSAMEEAKVSIAEGKSAEEQVNDVVEALRPVLPIKFEKRKLEIVVPAKFANQSFRILKSFSTVQKSEWMNDGSLKAVVEIPAGMQDEFFAELNKICHGEVGSKILERK